MKNLICLLILLIGIPVWAVQATINMPSSDVLPTDRILFKDVTNVYAYKNSGTTIPSINFGLGHGTEFSVGVPITMHFVNSTFTTKLAIEGKKTFFIDDNTRVTFGGGVFPYLNGGVAEGFFYGHATRLIDKTGTAISLGGYAVGDNQFINSGGMLIILEQKLLDKLRLVSEFTTGDNSRANFGVGLKYKPTKDFAVTGAVILPAHDNNVGFQIIVSKFVDI